MNNTTNIPHTALKTAVHRIIQQQPTNQQPEASQATLDGLECLTYQALKLTTMAENILEAIYDHRNNYPGIIQRNIVDHAEDTLAECALLHQTLEETLDDNL